MLFGFREPREFLETLDLSLLWSAVPCIGGARLCSFSAGDTPFMPSLTPEAAAASPCGTRTPCVSCRYISSSLTPRMSRSSTSGGRRLLWECFYERLLGCGAKLGRATDCRSRVGRCGCPPSTMLVSS